MIQVLWSVLVAFILIPTSAAAAQFCDSVVTNRAFNTSHTEQQAKLYNSARSQMCQESWSNFQEFKSKAQQLGISGGFAAYSFGLSSGDSNSSTSVQQARDKYCNMSDTEFASDYSTQSSSVVADEALRAWTSCVNAYLASVQQDLFAQVIDSQNRYIFDIKLLYRTNAGQPLEISALNIRSGDVEVTCYDGDVPIKATPKEPYRFKTLAATVRCVKSKPVATMSSNNTTGDTIAGIYSVGQSPSTFEREQITAAIASLEKKLAEASRKFPKVETGTLTCNQFIDAANDKLDLVVSEDIKFKTAFDFPPLVTTSIQ